MKLMSDIRKEQQIFNANITAKAHGFVGSLPKEGLEAILLSGSLARGDYFPGKYGAKIDLTVMTRKGSFLTAEALLGKDEDPGIPYHCVQRDGEGYQVAFSECIDASGFQGLGEAKKYALLESEILWEAGPAFSEEFELMKKTAITEQKRDMVKCVSYIRYLLSDYKVDRWARRDAYPQLHANLNTAIGEALKCLFYANGKYAPAEDRRMYYSYSLERLPADYADSMRDLLRQDIGSEADYSRRESLFRKRLLAFLERFS